MQDGSEDAASEDFGRQQGQGVRNSELGENHEGCQWGSHELGRRRIVIRTKVWSVLMVLVILVSLFVPVGTARAWEQPTHSQINFEAGRVFLRKYASSGMDKYRLGRFSQQGLDEQYRGIAVESRSALIDPWRGADLVFDAYKIGERSLTLGQWVFYGGDWADEPHLYASVRHFYDPWSLWGQPYLTDQYEFHGWYDDPKIDARTWGLDHPDNPFSFKNGLRYYKAAMEVPESGDPPARLPLPDHFKLNVDLVPKDQADERGMYLALAYRALGESMHMLGDMTQPAHVRNDAHALDEPIEKAVKRATVKEAAANPAVDAHIARFLKSAGGELQTPADLFRQVAIFTNHRFYSADTIFDAEAGVMPQNIDRVSSAMGDKHPYQSPQFKDLVVDEITVEGWLRDRTTRRLSTPLINDTIPLVQERLSFHWFDPDMTTKEKVARLANLAPYHIPSSFGPDQARVLMPVAIYACADLMHHFFPTLELGATYENLGVVEEEVEGRETYSRQVVEIATQMVHRQSEDAAWSDYGLNIAYSGPAELVFARDNQILKTRQLHFVEGQLAAIEDHKGRMVEEPLRVFVAEPGIPLIEEEAFYEVEKVDGTTIFLQIEGGSRIFKSPVHEFEFEKEEDITGLWDGFLVIGEADRILRVVEDVFVAILAPVFGEEKAREAFAAGVETPGLGREIPMALIIDEHDEASGSLRVTVRVQSDDGSLAEDVVPGTYHHGVLTFSMRHADGSEMAFEGTLQGKDEIRGTFSVSAWGAIKEAASGEWEVVRDGD